MATAKLPRGKPFQRGNTIGAQGRPPGTRNKATRALDALMSGDAEEIITAVLRQAKQGDPWACLAILARIAPVPKDRHVLFDLPVSDTAENVALAQAAIVEGVAAGELRPSEGQALADLLELRRRSLESCEFERRLLELEQRSNL